MRLDGQTALVTGGASGIGKATVLTLARSGASVICADVNEQGAAELVREAAAADLTIEAVGIDLADPQSTRRTAAAVLARRGRVDILVNGAGWGGIQPYMDTPAEVMDRLIAINLGGPVHLTQALLPRAAARSSISRAMRDASAAAARQSMPPPKAASSPSPSPLLGKWPATPSTSTASVPVRPTRRCWRRGPKSCEMRF